MIAKTKEQAISEVANYITPPDCFVWFTGNEKGWEPIGLNGCAHYVAHQQQINGSGSLKCDLGLAIQVPQVVQGIPQRSHNDQVRVGDVWAKLGGKDQHCGIVTVVTPGNPPVIQITHCSSRAGAVITSDYGSGISGGDFYGSSSETGWLGNCNSKEIHDLSNTNTNCQIGEIRLEHKVYFSSAAEAIAYGYNPCSYCHSEESSE